MRTNMKNMYTFSTTGYQCFADSVTECDLHVVRFRDNGINKINDPLIF